MSEWVTHVISPQIIREVETSITLSAPFAEKVLATIARVWANTKIHETGEIYKSLQTVACIPTKKGMSLPKEAYFPRVDLFEDRKFTHLPECCQDSLTSRAVPVTTLPVKGNMERLLSALGVRKHVDLQLVFSRLLGGGQWSSEQVVSDAAYKPNFNHPDIVYGRQNT